MKHPDVRNNILNPDCSIIFRSIVMTPLHDLGEDTRALGGNPLLSAEALKR